MKKYLAELQKLFFPPQCPACGEPLPAGAHVVCPTCSWNLPTTGFETSLQNPVFQKFEGLATIQSASSHLFFSLHSPYQALIHNLKFYGQWKLCQKLGQLMGHSLLRAGRLPKIDLILPVPLHVRRHIRRGYNQSYYLSVGIGSALESPVCVSLLRRTRYTKPQSSTSTGDRWTNVQGIFKVRHPERLAGKEILLVDDVLTTGATLIACAEAIHQAAPSCRIHIATLAVSRYQLFQKRG